MQGSEERDRPLYRERLPEIERLCRSAFSEFGAHGWEHVERVRSLCRSIGASEGADLEVLDAAALFHDAARGAKDHALAGAEYAKETLTSMGFSPSFCARVHSAISSHSFSSGRAAETLEGKVLADADRLDAMGAIGIYRTIQQNCERKLPAERVAEHISEKLIKLAPLLYTETARRIGSKRAAILQLYLDSLQEELSSSRSSK
ncbi:MAG: HD domain-containing protein [Candidatus Methanomethylicia archaeon]|nr:HD domain-containing protein [Candidatus Methanomethylicia archaeon]